MSTTPKSERNLHPAYGNLELAVVMMAGRYAESYADWVIALHRPGYDRANGLDRPTLRRRYDRQHAALRRLTAALARRSHSH